MIFDLNLKKFINIIVSETMIMWLNMCSKLLRLTCSFIESTRINWLKMFTQIEQFEAWQRGFMISGSSGPLAEGFYDIWQLRAPGRGVL